MLNKSSACLFAILVELFLSRPLGMMKQNPSHCNLCNSSLYFLIFLDILSVVLVYTCSLGLQMFHYTCLKAQHWGNGMSY